MAEFVRRLVLVLCTSLGIWLMFVSRTDPYVFLEKAAFSAEQQSLGGMFLSSEEQFLKQLPLVQYVSEVTRGKVMEVAGDQWRELLGECERTPGRPVFRGAGEAPVAELGSRLGKRGDTLYLVRPGAAAETAIRLKTQQLEDSDFGFGSGLSVHPRPPAALLWPHRQMGLVVLALGLIFYVLRPAGRRDPEEVCYPRWRVILGDFGWLLLFVPFFALPILICGSSGQALTQGVVLAIVFWSLALLGNWIPRWMIWYAELSMRALPDSIELRTADGERSLRFAEMASYQRVALIAPRWLRWLLWIGALSGRGAQRMQLAGQALILSSASQCGLAINLKAGGTIFLWGADPEGSMPCRGAEQVVAALDRASVLLLPDTRTVAAISPPICEGGATLDHQTGSARYWMLALSPFALVLVAFYVFGLGQSDSAESAPGAAGSSGAGDPTAFAHDQLWQLLTATPESGHINIGTAGLAQSDGGCVVAGAGSAGENEMDFLFLAVDSQGAQEWIRSYGTERIDHPGAVTAMPDGGFLVAGLSWSTGYGSEPSAAYVVRTSPAGELQWQFSRGSDGIDVEAQSAAMTPQGTLRVAGLAGGNVFVLDLDHQGQELGYRVQPLDTSRSVATLQSVALCGDGGVVAVGESMSQEGGFLDLLLVRWDAAGEMLWRKTFGGQRRESGAQVIERRQGGFAATGVVSTTDSGNDLYLVLCDRDGALEREVGSGGPGDQSGVALAELPDGSLSATGESRIGVEAYPHIFVIVVDPSGGTPLARWYGQAGIADMPRAIVAAADGSLRIIGEQSRGDAHGSQVSVLAIPARVGGR